MRALPLAVLLALGTPLALAQTAPAQPGNAVTGGDLPGSFKLPGADTSVRIYGYVKLDAVYSDKSAGVDSAADLMLVPQTIPVGPNAGANEKGQLKLGARESRIGVTTGTPTAWGALTTLLEGDFYGADGNETVSNSSGFRLRHAYGVLGSFGAGQTWTNFMNVPAFAETLDFGGPVGELFVRQAQVRWTQKFERGEWAVSLENPESVFAVPGTGVAFRADDDRYPDIVGRVTFNTSAGQYWIAALVRNIRADSAAAPAAADNKWGAGIAVSGVVPTIGKDDLRFEGYGGNGIGRYNNPGFYVDGVIDASGRIALPDVVGGYVAYRHFWTPDLRSSLVLSASRADNPAGTFGTINKSDRSAHVNFIWSAAKNVDVGIEYIRAQRETEDGQDGSLNRVQFSAKYAF
jgi:hypothetical protein